MSFPGVASFARGTEREPDPLRTQIGSDFCGCGHSLGHRNEKGLSETISVLHVPGFVGTHAFTSAWSQEELQL